MPWRDSGESPVVFFYLRYLQDRPDSVIGALEAIASADGAALVHCAAGKDRTGVICALALSAAGVERDAIVADYALTAERNGAIMARLRASPTYAADLEGSPDDAHLARPEYMARVLELLDERHGGPVAWLRERGFDPAPLRERLTG
jgi:protein tyrosine/serine phosphatase